MKKEAGSFRSDTDSNGTRFYLHRIYNGARTASPQQHPARAGVALADPDILHQIYGSLLGHLSLCDTHRCALQQRGLGVGLVEQNGYRTLPRSGRAQVAQRLQQLFGDKLRSVPGFVVKESQRGPYLTLSGAVGLVVPCRDECGRIVALKVRADDPKDTNNRYSYISSTSYGGPGPGARVHVPWGVTAPCPHIRLTEGELKADVAFALSGMPTLSVPGVTNWRPALEVLKALQAKTIRVALDMDAWVKPNVARALSAITQALVAADLSVELERWDVANGKGIDDLLAAGKVAELVTGDQALAAVKEILAAASAKDNSSIDELERLGFVLDTTGEAGLYSDDALLEALARLSRSDPRQFALVRTSMRQRGVHLRDLDNSLKFILKDLTGSAEQLAHQYFEQDGTLCWLKEGPKGPDVVPLCNFSARIVEQIIRDDGAEKSLTMALQGELADGTRLPRVEVPAEKFCEMNWVVPAWGAAAVVHAGRGIQDHLRAALQLRSEDIENRTIFGHTGWRQIDGTWFFLHAGGAIGPQGPDESIVVSLPESLKSFNLPSSVSSAELQESIRSTLRLLALGPDRITFPVFGATFRAPIDGTDFSLHIHGPTGSFKSELAALFQQFLGAAMNARNLPANWWSTANSLEALAFAAKDVLMVVDDFCAAGTIYDIQRLNKEADRLFRGQGNHAGRQRLCADASQRTTKMPRGLILSTGEVIPRGQSLRARLLCIEVSPGDLGPQPPEPNAGLTECQHDANSAKYAQVMAAYIQWLARNYVKLRGEAKLLMTELRSRFSAQGQHARTAGIAAEIALGFSYFLAFAFQAGGLTETEVQSLWARCIQALVEACNAQESPIANANPAERFVELISAAISSGDAHVVDEHGHSPAMATSWGWTTNGRSDLEPRGKCIGWLVPPDLYLDPDASYAAVQQLANSQGEALSVDQQTLRRRLRDCGLLAGRDEARDRLTVRRVLQGRRRTVLHLSWTTFGQTIGVPAPIRGPVPWAGNGAVTG
jgi:hypothetical protein